MTDKTDNRNPNPLDALAEGLPDSWRDDDGGLLPGVAAFVTFRRDTGERELREFRFRFGGWIQTEPGGDDEGGSPLDRLLDLPGSDIRSDAELDFIERKIDKYLRNRRRLKADEAEAEPEPEPGGRGLSEAELDEAERAFDRRVEASRQQILTPLPDTELVGGGDDNHPPGVSGLDPSFHPLDNDGQEQPDPLYREVRRYIQAGGGWEDKAAALDWLAANSEVYETALADSRVADVRGRVYNLLEEAEQEGR